MFAKYRCSNLLLLEVKSIINHVSLGGNTMKLIVAYIQPERLNAVKQALYEQDVYKMSVTNALGCGEQKGYHETYRGAEIEVNLLKKIRLEIALNDDFLQPAIDAIIKGAKTGQIGDGKIFIQNLDECIRIRTGETGKDAIG
jgi:nitrogen regulatory protein P-II 1